MTFDGTLPVEYPLQAFLDGFHLLEFLSADLIYIKNRLDLHQVHT
jgi:hypothetical protein